MDARQSNTEDISPAKAVMLGALAPGVNVRIKFFHSFFDQDSNFRGPTWNTLKIAFLMLGLCLSAMLGLAFSSSDSMLIFHVAFLVLIAGTLFLLLTRFLAETGLVSIEHQLQELGLEPKDNKRSD